MCLSMLKSFFSAFSSIQVTPLSGAYKFVSCPQPVKDTGCTYCELPQFPSNRQIDYERQLRNSKVALYKHALILHGLPDHKAWPRRFEMAPDSIISTLNALKRQYTDGYHPSLISMTSLQEPANVDCQLVGLYPDGLVIHVPNSRLKDFTRAFLDGKGGEDSKEKAALRETFKTRKLLKDYVLVCGHYKRDIRCGLLGPLVKAEFEKAFQLAQVPKEKVGLGYISHIGGHSFAANVLIFKKNGDVIWYGRVEQRNVQGIVLKTVLGNEIIEELYRG
ncbi:hypothetical protein FOA43_003073 [Brettanomyces nanus]|uniref:Altered inheritance of mitochondria protein 32 n=1 Tax=Eeniella nana TaxID=13502 RepID=A0A875S9H9_EENNA|nr:uncharacterized protein FOA43_003073 [Brettanomyces nanus]QPG75714.1 hypothetical protein FOA43_003073 [Brettanomyces nanus]